MIIEAHISEFDAGFGDTGASAENVGNELVRRDVVFVSDFVKIDGIIGEAEAGNAEALIIHRIVVERIIIAISVWYDVGDADDGVVIF